jgi:hypothetical protein
MPPQDVAGIRISGDQAAPLCPECAPPVRENLQRVECLYCGQVQVFPEGAPRLDVLAAAAEHDQACSCNPLVVQIRRLTVERDIERIQRKGAEAKVVVLNQFLQEAKGLQAKMAEALKPYARPR